MPLKLAGGRLDCDSTRVVIMGTSARTVSTGVAAPNKGRAAVAESSHGNLLLALATALDPFASFDRKFPSVSAVYFPAAKDGGRPHPRVACFPLLCLWLLGLEWG